MRHKLCSDNFLKLTHHNPIEFDDFMRVVAAFPLLLVSLLAAFYPTRVSADLTVVSYINGVLSTEDTAALEQVVANFEPSSGGARRALRNQDRHLWSNFCNRVCTGWPRSQCYVMYSKCTTGRRRSLPGIEVEAETEEMLRPNYRELAVSSSECDSKMTIASDAMVAAVSPAGQAIIVNSTSFLCFADCMITGFRLWNADCDRVTRPSITDGALICRNDYAFTIEVLTERCVNNVRFQLSQGSVVLLERSEGTPPYTLFGNKQADLEGPAAVGLADMAPGAYTLTATPDSDPDLTKSISFTLMDC